MSGAISSGVSRRISPLPVEKKDVLSSSSTSTPSARAASKTCKSVGTTRTRRSFIALAKTADPPTVKSYGNVDASVACSSRVSTLGRSASTPAAAMATPPSDDKSLAAAGESVTTPGTMNAERVSPW